MLLNGYSVDLTEENTFFSSDLHLGHKRILEYQPNRAFSSVEEMDEAIIENWNKIVPPNGVVINTGDFAFASRTRIGGYRARLNGSIILVKGNHDRSKSVDGIFDYVTSYLEVKVGRSFMVCMHYPMADWKFADDGTWMIHGHYHGGTVDCNLFKRMDVGIDTHPELRPYTYAEVKAFMDARTQMPNRHND
jgi:calcineurin-like phosphoesterase family protein